MDPEKKTIFSDVVDLGVGETGHGPGGQVSGGFLAIFGSPGYHTVSPRYGSGYVNPPAPLVSRLWRAYLA